MAIVLILQGQSFKLKASLASGIDRIPAMNWFLLLKFFHVLFAITAVGSNITYAIWGARAKAEKEHLGFALRGIKFIDDRVANPAYGGVLVTGLAMTFVGHIPIVDTLFVKIGLIGFIILAGIAVGFYSPTLRKQINTLESDGWDSPGYRSLDRRSTIVGIVLAVLVVLIVLDMVVKPTL
jgi:hypothetical protein